MKRKILSVLICMAIVAGTITGCGVAKAEEPVAATEETVETVEPEVEETVEVETEEAVNTEEVTEVEVEEAVEETAEAEEVSDFSDRENIKLYYNLLNTKDSELKSVCFINDIDPYDSNDYICVDAMRELEARGYDIDDYTIINRIGINKEDKEFVMWPILVKNTDVDSTRENLFDIYVKNTNTGIDFEAGSPDANVATFLNYIITDVCPKMIEDSSYEQIQFEIVDHKYVTSLEEMCGISLNEFFNAVIYDTFVNKTSDISVFDFGNIINCYVPIAVD